MRPAGIIAGMDADTRFILALTRHGPRRWRWRMRVALLLYLVGLHRIAAVIANW